MMDSQLKSKINLLWNKFWSGGISNPLQAIEQMSYLIFMKRLEDDDVLREQNARLSGGKFKSVFPKKFYRWSVWTQYPAGRMLEHVRDEVFPFLRMLNGGEGSAYSRYMKNASFSIPTASLLAEAVRIISDMHIKERNRDAQGDLYEYLLGELQTAGKNGQFRTPRHVIRMMVDLADPKFGERVCDPACGTAGFLVAALEHILKSNTSRELAEKGSYAGDKLGKSQWKVLRESTLYGYDFDDVMLKISMMNLMMHGIGNPNVEQKSTLSRRYEESECYDVILANPPFKGSIDESDVGESFRTKTKKTELLFLELMYNLLVRGGRCAVIVPDGVLFGSSKAHVSIRRLVLEKCRLDAVISMPSGVFKPYAGVSTAVLFFTKGERTKDVWFYDMQADGFSLDDKRVEQPEKNDIPDILEKFGSRRRKRPAGRKGKCFFVPFEEIRENGFDLSISKYKEIEYEEVKYEKPAAIKKKILEYEKKIMDAMRELDV